MKILQKYVKTSAFDYVIWIQCELKEKKSHMLLFHNTDREWQRVIPQRL